MMKVTSKTIGLAAGIVVIAGLSYLSIAGDLVPPPGAPVPTMHSLDEIYDEVRGVSDNLNGLVFGLETAGLLGGTTDPGPVVVVPGDGLLFAVVVSTVSGVGWVDLSDGDGAIGQFAVTEGVESATKKIVLSARYSGGLRAQRRTPGGAVTFLYIPDP